MISPFKPTLGWEEFWRLFLPNTGAVDRFEREFAKVFEAKEAVAFPYGRSAQWAFLRAIGVENAEIIMPAYTCSVVAHAVTLSGNVPRFIDINLDDYNMNLDMILPAINENTRAIVATHTFGYPQDVERLETIVKEAEVRFGHKIWLIQDCAHAFGASWNGRLINSSGDVALYGLNISKIMTTIFGGILTFRDVELAKKVRIWRDNHYKKPSLLKGLKRRLYLLAVYIAFNEMFYGLTWWLQNRTSVLNRFTKAYHLDDKIHFPPDYLDKMLNVEAAVGLAQLKKYPKIISNRRENADWYSRRLEKKEGWVFPPIIDGATYSHYVIRVPDRTAVISEMAAKGVHFGELIQYSIPALSCYEKRDDDCPLAKVASECTINIPISLSKRKKRKNILKKLGI